MKFEKGIMVAAPPAVVWGLLWNIERIARCLPGCREARTLVPHERYIAVVSERVGPFRVQFPLDIQVLEAEEPRHLKAVASGRDTVVASSLKVMLDLRLEPVGSDSRLAVVCEASVLGKVSTLGYGIIQHKAEAIMTQFAEALQRELEADSRPHTPAG